MQDDLKLLENEKNEIISNHKRLVDEFNLYLPNEIKLSYDEELNDKLDDPKFANYYLTITGIDQKIKKQHEIYLKLISDYGDIPSDQLYLARSFASGLKTEDTDEAREYNVKLYEEYKDHPDIAFYKRYKNVLEFDPEKLINVLDDPQKLLDFYKENQAVCDDAFVFASAMGNPDAYISPGLRKAISGIQGMVEVLAYPAHFVKNQKIEPLAFPDLTDEQAQAILAGNPLYMSITNPISLKFNDILGAKELEKIKDSFNVVKNYGLEVGKDFFFKYVALKFDSETNSYKEMSIDNAIISKRTDDSIIIRERTPKEVFELKRINSAFDNEYLNIFKRNFSNNYDKKPFDYEEIRINNRGNLFERFFNRTSDQYKEFIEALRDFNDNSSPNYLNRDYLRNRAIAYNDYKISQGLSFDKMSTTSQNRMKLASAVIKTLDDMDKDLNGLVNEVNKNIYGAEEKKQFLNEADVSDEINTNVIDNEANVLENVKDLSM